MSGGPLSPQPRAPGTDFVWPVRVYYEDTDAGGVVYYANYLNFMERARTEWLRFHGFEQTGLQEEHGVIFVVRSVQVEYLRPARFNDLLEVTVRAKAIGRSRIEFAQTVEQAGDGTTLARAAVGVVCVNGESFRPVSIPGPVRDKIGGKS